MSAMASQITSLTIVCSLNRLVRRRSKKTTKLRITGLCEGNWTPLPVGFRTWLWRDTCLLLLISMRWHRQTTFASNGDKLSSSAECRIGTQGLWNWISSRVNARWQTDWAIEDQAENLNSIARPYDQPEFSRLVSLATQELLGAQDRWEL